MKRFLFAVILVLIILIGVYITKSRLGIDISKSFNLVKKMPVQVQPYFVTQPKVVHAQVASPILREDFQSKKQFSINWTDIWMREEDAVSHSIQDCGKDMGDCLIVVSKSEKDWSIRNKNMVKTEPGDIFSFSGKMFASENTASGTMSVIPYDNDQKVIKWHFARKTVRGEKGENIVKKHRFVVPEGVGYIQFRLTGSGMGEVRFDDIVFQSEGNVNQLHGLEEKYLLKNGSVSLLLDVLKKEIVVTQGPIQSQLIDTDTLKDFFIVSIERIGTEGLQIGLSESETSRSFTVLIQLMPESEVTYEIDMGKDDDFDSLVFPRGFGVSNEMYWIMPTQEGLVIQQNDLRQQHYRFSSGRPMAFIGVYDDFSGAGWIQIVETPIDYELIVDKKDGVKNRWLSQKAKFGYPRKIRYSFFNQGGYFAAAKRYREYAKEKGWIKKLKDKDRKGNIDKLIGAINVWYWGVGKADFAKELKDEGIEKVLFSNSNKRSAETINSLGYLSSTYDIYQDVYPPDYHDVIKQHDGWPEDLVLLENGDWMKGWTIKRGLKEYPGGVINSQRGLERAKRLIPEDLEKTPYNARFIDTTTASLWREDYSSEHPLTRRDDMKYKMDLLDFVSGEMGLVTGSEDGVDIAVSYTDYFEGMMSIRIGRLSDSGRGVAKVKYVDPPENFLKYQIGTDYRVPLWELVFHDSIVSTWYWGDSSNRIPEYWWKKDLFNILYGNMPLWAIRDHKHWEQYKDRFIESYKNVCPVFKKVGYEEMVTHRFVTEDHNVQETTFSNNVRVVVNFSEESHELEDVQYTLPSHGYVVLENGTVWKKGTCN